MTSQAMSALRVTYHAQVSPEEVQDFAEAVLLEQTVETPRSVAFSYPFTRTHLAGSLEEIAPLSDGGFSFTLSLPLETASADPFHFLNVILGNSSLYPQLTLHDLDLPSDFPLFNGPAFGMAGLRDRLGVEDVPPVAAVLKPVGLDVSQAASLCKTLAEGGIHLIKDDHFLGDHPFCPFEARLRACQGVVEEVAARTGHQALYAPNLSGTPEAIRRQLDLAQEAGVGAVMVAPMLVGLPFFYEITHQRAEVPVLAHPSFAGTPQIDTALLFGRIFRLYGADAVIFTNYGGRFPFDQSLCGRIAGLLREEWHGYRPTFPVPAGGMTVARAEELVSFFGKDTILLIGGSLLEAGERLKHEASRLVERVRETALQTGTSS